MVTVLLTAFGGFIGASLVNGCTIGETIKMAFSIWRELLFSILVLMLIAFMFGVE